jgi:hypothetical protein
MSPPASSGRSSGCPSDLRLDELLNGDLDAEGAASLRAHVDHCVRCRARTEAFASVALPPWQTAPTPATPKRRRPWPWLLGAALPAAAVVVLALQLPRHEEARTTPANRTKGGWTLSLYVKRSDGRVERLADSGVVHPGDELRFAVTSARPGHVAVFSRDAKGSASLYVPFGAETGSVSIAAGHEIALPGSVETDATLGPEHLTAVRCDEALSPQDLRRELDELIGHAEGSGAAGIGSSRGCVETSVVFRKEPSDR